VGATRAPDELLLGRAARGGCRGTEPAAGASRRTVADRGPTRSSTCSAPQPVLQKELIDEHCSATGSCMRAQEGELRARPAASCVLVDAAPPGRWRAPAHASARPGTGGWAWPLQRRLRTEPTKHYGHAAQCASSSAVITAKEPPATRMAAINDVATATGKSWLVQFCVGIMVARTRRPAVMHRLQEARPRANKPA
jgi:hypothetical protein